MPKKQGFPSKEFIMIPWLVKPEQTEPKILEWAKWYPQWMRLDTVHPWSHTVYAITITDRKVPDQNKRKYLVAAPHGHEPAGTAACMNFINQLLEGAELDGTLTQLDVRSILQKTVLTFIPDANPEGRSRSPEAWWDGLKYSNEEFLKFAFGIEANSSKRFKRVDRWKTTEEQPALIGVAYERIDEITYVEPNRDWSSSLFRLVHLLTKRHQYDQFLDLHQTEFERSQYNCMILLPIIWSELSQEIQKYSQTWANEITQAWRQLENVNPQNPSVLGYTGQQRAYFEQRWGELYRTLPTLTVEVQNNNPHTPPDMQRRLSETAIRISVERLS